MLIRLLLVGVLKGFNRFVHCNDMVDYDLEENLAKTSPVYMISWSCLIVKLPCLCRRNGVIGKMCLRDC